MTRAGRTRGKRRLARRAAASAGSMLRRSFVVRPASTRRASAGSGEHRAGAITGPTIFESLIRLHIQVKNAATLERMTLEQDRRIAEVVNREQSRLRRFI